jgi:hypothetical protein
VKQPESHAVLECIGQDVEGPPIHVEVTRASFTWVIGCTLTLDVESELNCIKFEVPASENRCTMLSMAIASPDEGPIPMAVPLAVLEVVDDVDVTCKAEIQATQHLQMYARAKVQICGHKRPNSIGVQARRMRRWRCASC